MDGLELALMTSLYVVLIQALIEANPTSALEEQAMLDAFFTCSSGMDSNGM
jgi:hypothetical protein